MTQHKTDALLRAALATSAAPDSALLLRVRTEYARRANADAPVPRRTAVRRRVRAAAVVVALLAVLCTSAYAVSRILSGSQLSQLWGEKTLSRAFAEMGVPVFAQKEADGYRYTLTELVAGAELSQAMYPEGFAADSRMYVALAIERTDGAPMTSDPVHIISPLLQGYEPWNWNVYTLNTTMCVTTHAGVQYTLLSCDDFSALADTGVKLLIVPKEKNNALFSDWVSFDKNTGGIALKRDYADKAVLFDLPIPEQYADAQKAQEFLAQASEARTKQTTAFGMRDTNEVFYMTDKSHSVNGDEVGENAFWDDAKPLEETRHALVEHESDANGAIAYTYHADPAVNGSELSVVLLPNYKQRLEAECPPGEKIIARVLVYDDICKAVMLERDANGNITAGVVLAKPVPAQDH